MQGEVTAFREAVMRVTLVTESGGEVDVEAVVDTGFTEYLLLPSEIINGCGFYYFDTMEFTLANGERIRPSVYVGAVKWFGRATKVNVVCAETKPLIGMRLLQGCRVSLDVVDGGPVTITKI